jgi:hypothetical protein
MEVEGNEAISGHLDSCVDNNVTHPNQRSLEGKAMSSGFVGLSLGCLYSIQVKECRGSGMSGSKTKARRGQG